MICSCGLTLDAALYSTVHETACNPKPATPDAPLLLLLCCLLCSGHETTAAVLTWAMFCVVQNPEVEARLLAEIDSVIGDRAPGMFRVLCQLIKHCGSSSSCAVTNNLLAM
jgi:cytochrome P450